MKRISATVFLLLFAGTLYAQDSTSVVNKEVVYSSIRPLPVVNTNNVFRDVTLSMGGKSIEFPVYFDLELIREMRLVIRVATNLSADYRVEFRNSDSSSVVPIAFSGVVDTLLSSSWVAFNESARDTFKVYAKGSTSGANLSLYYIAIERRSYVTTLATVDTAVIATQSDLNALIAKEDTSSYAITRKQAADSLALRAAKSDTASYLMTVKRYADSIAALLSSARNVSVTWTFGAQRIVSTDDQVYPTIVFKTADNDSIVLRKNAVLEIDGNEILTAASEITELADVTITLPSTNDILTWNGSAWVNATGSGAGLGRPVDSTYVGSDYGHGSMWWYDSTAGNFILVKGITYTAGANQLAIWSVTGDSIQSVPVYKVGDNLEWRSESAYPRLVWIETSGSDTSSIGNNGSGDMSFQDANTGTKFLKDMAAPLFYSASWQSPDTLQYMTINVTSRAIVIDSIRYVIQGSTPSVTPDIRFAEDPTTRTGGTALITSPSAVTSTSGVRVASFNNATIAANRTIWWRMTAKSGTVNEIHATIWYHMQ